MRTIAKLVVVAHDGQAGILPVPRSRRTAGEPEVIAQARPERLDQAAGETGLLLATLWERARREVHVSQSMEVATPRSEVRFRRD